MEIGPSMEAFADEMEKIAKARWAKIFQKGLDAPAGSSAKAMSDRMMGSIQMGSGGRRMMPAPAPRQPGTVSNIMKSPERGMETFRAKIHGLDKAKVPGGAGPSPLPPPSY